MGAQNAADDARCEGVGDDAFQAIPHFNAHEMVLWKNQKDDAVVFPFLSYFPLLRQMNGKVFERLTFQRWKSSNNNLVAGFSLK